MAYAYILKGDKAKARQMVDKCIATTSDFDIDKRARAEAEIAMDASEEMLRARFNFEFGRYEESLRILKSFTPRAQDAAEHAFRTARAEEKLGRVDVAMSGYDKVISLSANSKRYFGPYSAVYAADICIKRGDKARAKKYLATARKLNVGEYKKELDQRIELTERAMK